MVQIPYFPQKKSLLKKTGIVIAVLCAVPFLSGSGGGDTDGIAVSPAAGGAFYKNIPRLPIVGDPFILYEQDEKIFYLYGTTRMNIEQPPAANFQIYRSKDMQGWEFAGLAFDRTPAGISASWMQVPGGNPMDDGSGRFWAPEVFKLCGLYYMYYTAPDKSGVLQNSVAWAEHPGGPFSVDFTHPLIGETGSGFNGSLPLFDFTDPDGTRWPGAIDGTVLEDADGELYYYIARDQHPHLGVNGSNERRSTIWGRRMRSPYSLADEPWTQLTEVGRSTVEETGPFSQPWERIEGLWNEGPFVIKHDGKYYLTYSANYFGSRWYNIGYAVSDNPLGPFVKPAQGAMIMGLDMEPGGPDWDYFLGSGHHMFLTVGTQNYIVYHKLLYEGVPNNRRYAAIDTFGFRQDGSLYVNGPTLSWQPLPELVSGYANIAGLGKITAVNNTGQNIGVLTDGVVGLKPVAAATDEISFGPGRTEITVDFDSELTVYAALLYNSCVYGTRLQKIDSIEFSPSVSVRNILPDADAVLTNRTNGKAYMPAGSYIGTAVKQPVRTDKIVFTIDSENGFNLSELVILGQAW